MKKSLILAAATVAFAGAAHAAVTELVLYKDGNFRGASQTIKGEVANLENGFGREVSSLVARGGTWEVCTGDHFRGRCRALPEGEYASLGRLNERIVSVRFLGADAAGSRDGEWRDRRDARREGAREERTEWRDDASRAWRDRDDSGRTR